MRQMSDRIQPLDAIGPVPGSGQDSDEALNDPAKVDYKAGREYLSKKDYVQAAVCFHNALRGFEEQGNDQGVANAHDRIGDICMEREEFGKALDHYQRAFEICRKESDIFSLVALNKKKVLAYRKMGDLNLAMAVMMDILDHYTETRNPKGSVEVLEMIAEVYREKGENLKAADALRTIAGIHRNFGHKRKAEDFDKRALKAEQE
jgi:tetratricopeptide (TPR) repeat protein